MSAETEEKIEGAHNFRQVCGFPVFGVGQPNPEGIKIALEKIKGSCDEKNNKERDAQAFVINVTIAILIVAFILSLPHCVICTDLSFASQFPFLF